MTASEDNLPPRPWKMVETETLWLIKTKDGCVLGYISRHPKESELARADIARYVNRAINSYDAMLGALEYLAAGFDDPEKPGASTILHDGIIARKIRAAIAVAYGKK